MGRRRRVPPTWPGAVAARLQFEQGARAIYPSLRGRPYPRPGAGGFRYHVVVAVPFYGDRQITIIFQPGATIPDVYSDGPPSPHRYAESALCLWFPGDPHQRRWVLSDGLLDLIDLVVAHSFREAWWAETGEWPGDEVPHGQPGTRPTMKEIAA